MHDIPSGFITRLIELIQEYNLYEFNQDIWRHVVGVAMVPSYANIYLARRIDEHIKKLDMEYGYNGKSSILIILCPSEARA